MIDATMEKIRSMIENEIQDIEKKAYDHGYDEGYNEASENGYDDAHDAGYEEGCDAGYEQGEKEMSLVSEGLHKLSYSDVLRLQDKTGINICYGGSYNYDALCDAVKELIYL